jgi:ATP-dependent Clp protease ATP-binding subunit ClpA
MQPLDLIFHVNNAVEAQVVPFFQVVQDEDKNYQLVLKDGDRSSLLSHTIKIEGIPDSFQSFYQLKNGHITSVNNIKSHNEIPEFSTALDFYILQTSKFDYFIAPTLNYVVRLKKGLLSQATHETYSLLNASNMNNFILIRNGNFFGKILVLDRSGKIVVSKKTFNDFPAFSTQYPNFTMGEKSIHSFTVSQFTPQKNSDLIDITAQYYPEEHLSLEEGYTRESPQRISFTDFKNPDMSAIRIASLRPLPESQILKSHRNIPTVDIKNILVEVQDPKGRMVAAGEILSSFISDGIEVAQSKNWSVNPELDALAENIFAGLLGVKVGNVALLAEPGTGKSFALEDLAARFATGQVPADLRDYNLVYLNISALGSGNNYSGSYETKINALTKWVESIHGKAIVIIDEIHSLRGQGVTEGNANDVFSLLLPALGRGDLRVIGATSSGLWDYAIGGDEMLDRRFKRVQFDGDDDQAAVLKKMKNWISQNRVEYQVSDKNLKYIIEASTRFRPFRAQPGRSIELLEQVIGLARARKKDATVQGQVLEIKRSTIETAAVGLYKIKLEFLNSSENEKILKNIEAEFAKLQGMEDVKTFLLKKTFVYLSGLEPNDKPAFRTMLLGPSGGGKTTIVKALASGLSRPFIHITLGAIATEEAIKSRLADVLSKNPTGVILLDEIDDAKPEVINCLNDLLNSGEMDYIRRGNSGSDRPVSVKLNLKNNIVMAAANGSFNLQQNKNSIGFVTPEVNSENSQNSPAALRKVAEEFLPKKIADRFDGFFYVGTPSDVTFIEALKVAVIKLFSEAQKSKKALRIEYSNKALDLWANEKAESMSSRSFREIEKIVNDSVRLELAESMVLVNKDQYIEMSLGEHKEMAFSTKTKTVVKSSAAAAMRCENLILF